MATPTSTIHGYVTASVIDPIADWLLLDPASTGNYNKINRNVLLGITGSPIGSSDTQTLTNKVIGITNAITAKDSLLTLQNASDLTKQANFSLAGVTTGTTRTYALPNASVTLASLTGTETLTNKTITSPTITGGSIDNTTISVDAITGHTVSTTVTVGGVQMANGIVGTTGAVNTNSILAGAVVPNSLVASSGSGWAWQSWTPTLANITLGNGTQIAKYVQIGKTIFFNWSLVMGTTSAIGTAPTITLPVTSSSNYLSNSKIGIGSFKSGATDGALWANINSTTVMSPVLNGAATTYVGPQGTITASVPGTWSGAAADYLNLSGFYEAA